MRRILVTSASGANGDGYDTVLSFSADADLAGPFSGDAVYAVRATRQLDREARDRALAAARGLTVFFPEARVRAVIRAAAESSPRPG